MALNACELEIDLFCRGMRVPDEVPLAGVRGFAQTPAACGSGLDVAIQSRSLLKRELWVNVPVVERFARSSPYRLTIDPDGAFAVVDDRDDTTYAVRLPKEPAWYTRLTSRDIPMQRIGIMQGTYLAINVNPACAFWSENPRLNCKFCTTGRNVGPNQAAEKTIADVVETCRAAKEESRITFVHLTGGFQGEIGLDHIKPYVEAIKEKVGLIVGVQLTPEHDFRRYDELVAAGVDHLSFCVELFDPRWFTRICPGKARAHGQALYFDAMAYCVDLLPYGAVSGEVIAGLEPVEKTLEAIDSITRIRAVPTLSIFRPTIGSDLEYWPTPGYSEMRRVMTHMYDACRRAWLRMGVATTIEGSLTVSPDDAAMLSDPTVEFFGYEAYRRALRLAARPMLRRRIQPM